MPSRCVSLCRRGAYVFAAEVQNSLPSRCESFCRRGAKLFVAEVRIFLPSRCNFSCRGACVSAIEVQISAKVPTPRVYFNFLNSPQLLLHALTMRRTT